MSKTTRMELSSSGVDQKVQLLGSLPRGCLFLLRINYSFLWNFVKSGLMSGRGDIVGADLIKKNNGLESEWI